MKKPLEQRFWEKVDIRGEDECWNWKAYKNKAGYGRFQLNQKQGEYAHRVSYIIANGKIDDGLIVLHSCDRPSCVNPKHLRSGTQKENIIDCVSKKRHSGFMLYGKKSPKVKLNEKQVQTIRILKDCFSSQSVSEMFGISRQSINDIWSNRSWNRLTSNKQALSL